METKSIEDLEKERQNIQNTRLSVEKDLKELEKLTKDLPKLFEILEVKDGLLFGKRVKATLYKSGSVGLIWEDKEESRKFLKNIR